MIKAKCVKCGEEFEQDDKWKVLYDRFPKKVICEKCKKGTPATPKQEVKKEAAKSITTVNDDLLEKAKQLKAGYDALCQVFDKEECKDHLGGWTSTLFIETNKAKAATKYSFSKFKKKYNKG